MQLSNNTLSPSLKIAFLLSNGFEESQFTAVQRAVMNAGHKPAIIAPENRLVMGWAGAGWGLSFSIEKPISEALGSDYDALVLVGGERGIARLEANPHCRRILGHFLDAQKPVLVCDAAHKLLIQAARPLTGLSLSAPSELADGLMALGAQSSESVLSENEFILSSHGAEIEVLVAALADFFTQQAAQLQTSGEAQAA